MVSMRMDPPSLSYLIEMFIYSKACAFLMGYLWCLEATTNILRYLNTLVANLLGPSHHFQTTSQRRSPCSTPPSSTFLTRLVVAPRRQGVELGTRYLMLSLGCEEERWLHEYISHRLVVYNYKCGAHEIKSRDLGSRQGARRKKSP